MYGKLCECFMSDSRPLPAPAPAHIPFLPYLGGAHNLSFLSIEFGQKNSECEGIVTCSLGWSSALILPGQTSVPPRLNSTAQEALPEVSSGLRAVNTLSNSSRPDSKVGTCSEGPADSRILSSQSFSCASVALSHRHTPPVGCLIYRMNKSYISEQA